MKIMQYVSNNSSNPVMQRNKQKSVKLCVKIDAKITLETFVTLLQRID